MRRKSFFLLALTSLVSVALCQTSDESVNFDRETGHRNKVLTPALTVDPSNFVGTCGYSNPGINTIQTRMGGGQMEINKKNSDYADFGEFPWMVAVLKWLPLFPSQSYICPNTSYPLELFYPLPRTDKALAGLRIRRSGSESWIQDDYIGGGSLIHPFVVVTVAHLVRDPKKRIHLEANQIKIRAGEWMTDADDELYEHQDRNVVKIIVHEHYFRDSLYNDIALLILEAPAVLEGAPQIDLGCLAPQLPPPGTICFSMGWGVKDFSNKKVFSSKLKKIKLPLLGKETCEEYMRKTRLGNIFQLHQSLVCAGGEQGIGNCRGDRGSSLVCPINSGGSRFAIYGMYAYTLGCGVKDVPGVYVNVPNFFKWVEQKLANEGIDTKTYTYI